MSTQPDPERDNDRPMQSWPLYVLALPAAAAIWSGWVGLGGMTGFGVVHPLPGFADSFTINTAITLPIGVEAYAAFALNAWLTRKRLSDQTRRFAMVSALAALVLGGVGQIAYHLLEVAHSRAVATAARGTGRSVAAIAKEMPMQAPVFVTVLVAIFPVAVLGAGATLAHLIHRDARTGTTEPNGIHVRDIRWISSEPEVQVPIAQSPVQAKPVRNLHSICSRTINANPNLNQRSANPNRREPEPVNREGEVEPTRLGQAGGQRADQPNSKRTQRSELSDRGANKANQVQLVRNLIDELGYDAVTLDMVRNQLNLSKTTAYNRLIAARNQWNQEQAS